MKLNLDKIASHGYGDLGISTRIVGGERVPTLSLEIMSCPILEVEVGTNGVPGDAGHGGRTYFAIQDVSGTDITVTPIASTRHHNGGVMVEFRGSLECDVFISALKFAVSVLEGQLGRQ
jgi:hypothetical protein